MGVKILRRLPIKNPNVACNNLLPLLFLLGEGVVDSVDFIQRLHTGLVHIVLEESWSLW
jgi:hypothetical protein